MNPGIPIQAQVRWVDAGESPVTSAFGRDPEPPGRNLSWQHALEAAFRDSFSSWFPSGGALTEEESPASLGWRIATFGSLSDRGNDHRGGAGEPREVGAYSGILWHTAMAGEESSDCGFSPSAPGVTSVVNSTETAERSVEATTKDWSEVSPPSHPSDADMTDSRAEICVPPGRLQGVLPSSCLPPTPLPPPVASSPLQSLAEQPVLQPMSSVAGPPIMPQPTLSAMGPLNALPWPAFPPPAPKWVPNLAPSGPREAGPKNPVPGLFGLDQDPVRFHLEWSKEGVSIWIGLDAGHEKMLAPLVDQLQRWATSQDFHIRAIVCNGTPVQGKGQLKTPEPDSHDSDPASSLWPSTMEETPKPSPIPLRSAHVHQWR